MEIYDENETPKQQITEAATQKSQPLAWLGTKDAALYLGCKYGTLKTWRSRGEGPKYYVVHGKMVRYHIDDLNAYVRGESNR